MERAGKQTKREEAGGETAALATAAETPPTPPPSDSAPTQPAEEKKSVVPAGPPRDPDDLFVSCVPEAGPVARFAAAVMPKTGPYSNAPFIGVVRDMSVEGNLRYSPDEVVMIPGSEYRLYNKEYRKALADRALRLRTREDWEKQQAAAESGNGG